MRWPSSRTRTTKPIDSSLLTYESSFATSSTVTRMSIIGFAANPGDRRSSTVCDRQHNVPYGLLDNQRECLKAGRPGGVVINDDDGAYFTPPIKTASKCSSDSRFMGLSGHHPDRWVCGPGNHSRHKSGTEQNST